MTHAPKPHAPFAFLGRFWTPVGLGVVTIVAAFFRFYQLNTLPPALDDTSARIGLEALKIGAGHWLPTLSAGNGYAPLWIWLQSLSIHMFGHTAVALRLWPALLGTLAVVATWLWVQDWFDLRTAWASAVLMAVSPWAVTISRNGVESALPPLLVPLALWACSRALKKPGPQSYLALSAILTLSLFSGPIGWLLVGMVLILGFWRAARRHLLRKLIPTGGVGIGIFVLGLGAFAYLMGKSLSIITSMPQTLGIARSFPALGHNLLKVLLMFNVYGDENYRHNLSTEPLLNAFAGIMLIAGLLVAISRLHLKRYQILLTTLCLLLFPAVLATTGVPNSSWAVGALPLIFALSGLGVAYMLELWYTTFPINSAARTTGQAAIIILFTLSLLQGFTQYFRAWAGSTALYLAYDEGATQIALHVQTDTTKNDRFVVVPADQTPIIDYLDYGQSRYHTLTIPQLQSLPLAGNTKREFYIVTAVRDDAIKVLKAKFPGGVLRPHYSSFNQAEIFYTYEVTQ